MTAAESEETPTSPPAPPVNSNWASLEAFAPVLLFLGFNSTLGLKWAIGAASAWGVFAAFNRRRQGRAIGKLLPLITVAIVGRGLIGIITDSETVYFGLGIGTRIGFGIFLAGSVLVGKPLLARLAPYAFAFPRHVVEHRIYRSTMAHLTLAAALFQWIVAAFEIWLFRSSSVNQFVAVKFIVGWPAGMLAVMLAFAYAAFRLGRIPEFPGLWKMLEDQVEAQEKARAARRADTQ